MLVTLGDRLTHMLVSATVFLVQGQSPKRNAYINIASAEALWITRLPFKLDVCRIHTRAPYASNWWCGDRRCQPPCLCDLPPVHFLLLRAPIESATFYDAMAFEITAPFLIARVLMHLAEGNDTRDFSVSALPAYVRLVWRLNDPVRSRIASWFPCARLHGFLAIVDFLCP